MKTAAQVGQIQEEEVAVEKSFAVDTSFVLFFLAIEFGRSAGFAFESMFLGITLIMVMVLPYFAYTGEKPDFKNWLFGRSLILGFAIVLGIIFRQTLGIVLPEEFRFMPMTLLIVAAMLSCYIQFYSFLKLRLAK